MTDLLAGVMIVLFVAIGILFTNNIAKNIKNDGMAWFFKLCIIVIWLIFGFSSWYIISIVI